MEKIGKALGSYSENTLLDKLFFFELTVFSFLTGNNEMPLKNFSRIESPSGWSLSPAYDLLNVTIINPADKEELALPLVGKRKKLRLDHFKQLGSELGLAIKQIENVFQKTKRKESNGLITPFYRAI
jgi:serine/threonine-protein kinase HipA